MALARSIFFCLVVLTVVVLLAVVSMYACHFCLPFLSVLRGVAWRGVLMFCMSCAHSMAFELERRRQEGACSVTAVLSHTTQHNTVVTVTSP